MRHEKKLARENVLSILETNEEDAQNAEDRNEIREQTEEEKCLKDFIFPENLCFPVHKNFRLWLSTIPVPHFPQDFARRCFKISRELPTAIRPSSQKSLSTVTNDSLDGLRSHKIEFKKLLFSMTVMHAVIN